MGGYEDMITRLARKALRSILFVMVGLGSGSALAATVTINGNLQPPSPTMPVVFIASPLCTGQGVAPVTYRVYPVHVTQSGIYTIDSTSVVGDTAIYLHEGSFDPAASFPTCVQADNAAPNQIVFNMNAGTDYFVVVIDDTFAQNTGLFTVVISGPGGILVGTQIPTLSQWGMIILSTLLALGAIVAIRRGQRA